MALLRKKATRKTTGTSPLEVARVKRRAEVSRLYLRAWTQAEIGAEVGVSQRTISGDLVAIQAEWKAAMLADRGEYVARELRRLDQIEREAWGQWERSKLNAEETRTESGTQGMKTSEVSKGQCGDPRYLQVVRDCVSERSKLLGLYAPTKQEHTFNPTELTDEQLERIVRGENPLLVVTGQGPGGVGTAAPAER